MEFEHNPTLWRSKASNIITSPFSISEKMTLLYTEKFLKNFVHGKNSKKIFFFWKLNIFKVELEGEALVILQGQQQQEQQRQQGSWLTQSSLDTYLRESCVKNDAFKRRISFFGELFICLLVDPP